MAILKGGSPIVDTSVSTIVGEVKDDDITLEEVEQFLSWHRSAETLCWLWYVIVGLISIFIRSNAHALEL